MESLVDVANELRNINDSLVLDIYGKAKPEKEALLTNCENICYHGLVEPDKLIKIKNDDFYKNNFSEDINYRDFNKIVKNNYYQYNTINFIQKNIIEKLKMTSL